MKISRILFLGLLAVVTVTVLIGFFRSDEKKLVGTWGVPETDDFVFEVYENGYRKLLYDTNSIYIGSIDMSFKWEYEDDVLTLIPEDKLSGQTVSARVELDGDQLILIADDGSETSLVRKE
ncbi:hypothetical protein BN3662_01076 [Clostridiales bacterium CHKCI006]|nr:hypothetical protein BN3662_01076 [Clostridiales bacterium CHKCI006]